MKHRWMTTVALTLSFWSFITQCRADTPVDSCVFPAGLGEQLSKKYPGTALLTLADLVEDDRKFYQKDHGNDCPGLAHVDFYGDGMTTLAASSDPKRSVRLVVAHQTASGWELRLLETTNGKAVVWRQDAGTYRDIYGRRSIRALHPVVVLCSYEASTIVYSWTGSKVDKVWLAD
jgi:hypothetical protein